MVITFTNQKGGVAKTTTTLEFAYNLRQRGFSVLIIDCDPQANLSKAANGNNIPYDNGTIYDLLKSEKSIFSADGDYYEGPIYRVNMGVDIIPAPPDQFLALIETELASTIGREYRLRKALAQLQKRNNYDFILIDTPRSLGVLTTNALTTSDKVIVPCTAESFSVEGLLMLDQSFQAVKEYCNPNLEYAGAVITRFQRNTNMHKQYVGVITEVANSKGIKMFNTKIPMNIDVPESHSHQMALAEYSPDAAAAVAYTELTLEFLEDIGYGE